MHAAEARAVDLANDLGVTKPLVNNAIQRLQRDGYVDSAPYRAIVLTPKRVHRHGHHGWLIVASNLLVYAQ